MDVGRPNSWTSRSSAGLSLHHFVGPENLIELKSIHSKAEHTAIFYVSTILILYVIGLMLILVNHMNQTHGRWAWNCLDLWDELCPWSSSTAQSPKTTETVEVMIEGEESYDRLSRKRKWKLFSKSSEVRDDSVLSEDDEDEQDKAKYRGMSVVTLLDDEHEDKRNAKDVLETAL